MPHHNAGLARKCHKTLFFHPLTHNYLRCVFLVPKHDFSDFFPKVSAKPVIEFLNTDSGVRCACVREARVKAERVFIL